MFKSKKAKIAELEHQLREKKREIARLEGEIAHFEMKFESIQKTLESKPDDCTPGKYCAGCAFARLYHIYSRSTRDFEWVYLCNKAGSCEQFTKRSEVNDQT